MSQTSRFFDKTVWYKKLLAIFFCMNVFQKLNSYDSVKVEEICQYDNLLAINRFLFEILYTFTYLSYIAINASIDIEDLKREHIAVYSVDEVRRVLTEKLFQCQLNLKLPNSKNFKSNKWQKKLMNMKFQMINLKMLFQENNYQMYEPFDDYLEIVINFRFNTILTVTFPYTPLLIFVFN